MGFVAHAHQDWTNFQSAGPHFQNVPGSVCGISECEDENIGRVSEPCIGKDPRAQFGVQCCIDRHFSIVLKVDSLAVKDFEGGPHTPPRVRIEVSKI